MKKLILKIVALALVTLCGLSLISCAGDGTTDPIPVITRPSDTTREPKPVAPPHDHVWSELLVYTPYERPRLEDNSIGYLAYSCTVEGCEEVRDDLIRPVLIGLDFEGEMTFAEYLEQQDRVLPLYKHDLCFSAGTVSEGVFHALGEAEEQVFIVTPLALHELDVLNVSFDACLGVSSYPGRDTFFGMGKTGTEAASVYYFQLRIKDGKLFYLNNFTEMDLQTNMLLGYEFLPDKWYHFELEIDMAMTNVSIRVSEWNEDRTELVSTSHLGVCDKMQSIQKEGLDTVVFRISASNGLAAMDNFYVTLPEQ